MSILNNPTEAAPAKAALPAGAIPMAPKASRSVPPAHPGNVAADILEEKDVSGRKAAKAMGMSSNGLAKVLRGDDGVTAQTALRFGAYFGNGPDLWLQLQNQHDLWHAKNAIGKKIAAIVPLEKAEQRKRA